MKNTSVARAFYWESAEDFYAAESLFDSIEKTRNENQKFPGRLTKGQRGSAFFMLLQMSAEKLAKAVYSVQQGNSKWPGMTHDIGILKPVIMRIPQFSGFINHNQIVFDFLFNELNELQPSKAGFQRENLEYPWKTQRNEVKYPAKDLKLITKYFEDPMNRNIKAIMAVFRKLIESFDDLTRQHSF